MTGTETEAGRLDRDIPHYVYRCYDESGRLIYVGCTHRPAQRVASHRSSKWWGHQIASVRYVVYPNRDHALSIERRTIAAEQPRWNVKGRWAYRALWAAEDYADYYMAASYGAPGTRWLADHLERVAREAKRRYGVVLGEQVSA